MAFEVFKRKSRAFVKDPVMAIQSRGTISLNASAFQLLSGNGGPVDELQVELLYDPESVHDISWPFEQDNRWKGYGAER
jgi:hypothetical protein